MEQCSSRCEHANRRVDCARSAAPACDVVLAPLLVTCSSEDKLRPVLRARQGDLASGPGKACRVAKVKVGFVHGIVADTRGGCENVCDELEVSLPVFVQRVRSLLCARAFTFVFHAGAEAEAVTEAVSSGLRLRRQDPDDPSCQAIDEIHLGAQDQGEQRRAVPGRGGAPEQGESGEMARDASQDPRVAATERLERRGTGLH